MSRNRTLLLGIVQGALTLLGGYLLLVASVFGILAVYGMISDREYLGLVLFVGMGLVFAGLEFALARKTIRTFKRWRQQA